MCIILVMTAHKFEKTPQALSYQIHSHLSVQLWFCFFLYAITFVCSHFVCYHQSSACHSTCFNTYSLLSVPKGLFAITFVLILSYMLFCFRLFFIDYYVGRKMKLDSAAGPESKFSFSVLGWLFRLR